MRSPPFRFPPLTSLCARPRACAHGRHTHTHTRMLLRLDLLTTPTTPALRAAAAVRAAAFGGDLPPDRSPWARDAYVRAKTADAWKALEAKTSGNDPDWAGIRVLCLLATVAEVEEVEEEVGPSTLSLPLPPGLPAALRAASTDPSCCLPGLPGTGKGRRWAVGTLDLNFGVRLPSERLAAEAPGGGASSSSSPSLVYLSNVATAAPARRCGVASAMVRRAVELAPTLGAARVAVHSGTDPATHLYLGAGFREVARESVSATRARGEASPRTLFVLDC